METKYKTRFLTKAQKQTLRKRELRLHDYISNQSIEDFIQGKNKHLKFGNLRIGE